MATINKYQTVSGTTLYRVRYRTPDGRSTQRRGFTTKREAERWANTLEVSKMTGEYISPSPGNITVGQLGQEWLQRQRAHLKPSSFRPLEIAWRNHVVKRWGLTPIAEIRFSSVQGWVAELSSTLSASRVATIYSVLARVLDDAVRDRLLASNPARDGVKLPKRPPRRNVYLTPEQLEMLANESGRYRSLVLLLGIGGLRWGEACALRVGDVNFLKRRINLHRNAVQVGTTFAVGSLKSNTNRVVVLPPFVIDALAETARGKGPDDLLWPSQAGGYLGPPVNKSWLSGAVERCQRTDPSFPRVTAHALRHTAASLLIHAGANPKVVQRMLGHASAAMTLDVYADLFDSDLTSVAENVAKMWPQAGQTVIDADQITR